MKLPLNDLPKRDHVAIMKRSWGLIPKIKSFAIDKTGYGLMSAWITVDNINKIKKRKAILP